MTTICPTVTAREPHEYRAQMERLEPFAQRIHVDAADGDFAPVKLIGFDNIWWRGDRTIDLHVMYRRPFEHLEIILALKPRLVIVHAEAEDNVVYFADSLRQHGIEAGLALLPGTAVGSVAPLLPHFDHAMIFSGNLGHQGGSAVDFDLLKKAAELRRHKPALEIGWDGGVNDSNAGQLAAGGIEVLNVGDFIQWAADPAAAYAKLEAVIKG